MSRLIDDILDDDWVAQKEYPDGWYLAKPINKPALWSRIRDAIRIIRCKSFACHYKEDE